MKFLKPTLVGLTATIGLAGLITIASIRPTTAPSAPPKVTAKPAEKLHPLMIEAIRQRSYPGGPIKTEQSIGDMGGYTNSVVSYPSDGFTIYALMSTPDGPKPASGWPVVILNHGYIDPAAYQTTGPEYSSFIATLARNGYLVIKPDYRGHGNSTGSAEGGHYSPAYTYDVMNLIASLKKFDLVDPTRIGLYGHSMGGHVALRTAVVSPDVRATVLMAGVVGSAEDLFFNWPRRPDRPDMPSQIVRSNLQTLIAEHHDPHQNPSFWNRVSAISYVSAIKGPVQLHHGTADTNVPMLFSDHLAEALKRANKPHEYYVYPGGDHNLSADQAIVLDRMLAFFNANLKN